MIHLDTSFLIRALVRDSPEDRKLRGWLRAGEVVGVSSVSWTEFLCGPIGAEEVELAARIVEEPVPFVAADSAIAARLFNMAGRRKGSLIDCLIAATALRVEAQLATGNLADFRRFDAAGLRVLGA